MECSFIPSNAWERNRTTCDEAMANQEIYFNLKSRKEMSSWGQKEPSRPEQLVEQLEGRSGSDLGGYGGRVITFSVFAEQSLPFLQSSTC